MVVYTLEHRSEVGLRSTYIYISDFGKKKSSFKIEAHFDLGGYVNQQNCRIWVTENLQAYIVKPKHQNDLLFGTDFGPEA